MTSTDRLYVSIMFLNAVVFWYVQGHPAEGLQLLNFFTSPSMNEQRKITFNPGDGVKYRKSFEQKYGPYGKGLIEMLGQGSSTLQSKTSVYKEADDGGDEATKTKEIKWKNQ